MSAQQDEWTDWIEHDGKGCPIPGKYGEFVSLWVSGRETVSEGVACGEGGESWDWSNWPRCTKVIRYRIRKPRALLDLIQMIADLPEPTTAPAPGVMA